MKVVVLGAGVVGVTSAYELACDGHDVTVIDRQDAVAEETSHANGGQLSVDHGGPLAAPGVVTSALRWLGKKDAPMLYRLRMDPALWSWTLQFMTNCKAQHHWTNAERMLRVSLYSRTRLKTILDRETIAFDKASTGILTLYENPSDLQKALDHAHTLKELGAQHDGLSTQDCLQHEPALTSYARSLAGGILTPHDESGDCLAFTQELAKRCQNRGVTFRFGEAVTGFVKDGWKIKSVVTDKGTIDGDAFVLALGAGGRAVLTDLDLKLPIYPTKGYSITLTVTDNALAPRMSLTSYDHRLVFSRFGNKLRVAGMMEFDGDDRSLNAQRARVVLNNTLKMFPHGLDRDNPHFWTGLRPMTPDGTPIIGRGKHENLILNTGHGMLGWTMAAGSARLCADLVKGQAPEIDITDLGWERYA